MKKISKVIAILSSVAMLSLGVLACSSGSSDDDDDKPGNENPGTKPEDIIGKDPVDSSGKISSVLWGTWTRMDNGRTIRITDKSVTDASNSYYGGSQYNIKDFELESDNVLVYNGESAKPRLFRESGKSKSFKVKLAGLGESGTRAADDTKKVDKAIKDKKVKRHNKLNDSDAQEAISSDDGTVEFTDAVSGETQQITVGTSNGEVELELEPHFDGEDMGVIPVIEDDKCSFKVTYRTTNNYSYNYGYMDQSDNNVYLYSGNTYKIYLDIYNLGNEEMEDGFYEISCEDSNLTITGNKKALLNTVEAKSKKTIELDVRYGTIYDEYIDVPVNIAITDYATKREWLDSITLRFYRRPVYITVNAYSTLKTGNLHGFVIAPDGRSQYFDVSHGSERRITVPWTKGDSNYMLVINGADANNEMFYAFKVSDNQDGKYDYYSPTSSQIYDWEDFIKEEIVEDQMELKNSFESAGGNNTEKNAYNAGNGYKVIRSYIKKGDIDYYKLNINETTTTVSVKTQPLSDIRVTSRENGNELTFTADKGFDSYYWELNGNRVQKSDKYKYVLNKAELNPGVYELYLRAEKIEKIPASMPSETMDVSDFRSATIMFTVEE